MERGLKSPDDQPMAESERLPTWPEVGESAGRS